MVLILLQVEILDVQHRDSRRILREVFDGVVAGDGDPAAIHFEGNEFGISEFDELVVGHGVFQLAKFGGVVVIAEAHAVRLDLGADLVELLGVPLPIGEGEGIDPGFVIAGVFGRKLHARRVFKRRRRADDVLQSQLIGVGDDRLQLRLQHVQGIVRADAATARQRSSTA